MSRHHLLGSILAVTAACGGATPPGGTSPGHPADAAAPAGPDAARREAADHLAEAYLALTVDSIDPAPPAELAAIGWAVLGAGEAPAFGADAQADAALLRGAAATLEPGAEWRAIAAMAASRPGAHAVLLDADGLANLAAFGAGAAYVGPGMIAHHDAAGAAVVAEIVPGGPAEAAGLAVGDTLLAIDGAPPTPALLLPLLLRPAGRVELDVDRAGQRLALGLDLAAQPYPIVTTRIVRQAAVIRIAAITVSSDPARDTAALARAAVAALDWHKVRGLVIDLRGCPGGRSPIAVASVFTAADPILLVRDVAGAESSWPREGERAAWPHYLDVLVDDQTGSAAELLAFALHDQGGIRVVGQPSLGAMSVPATLQLDDGHALLYPAQRVLGPVSREPPRDGRVVPDQLVASPTAADLAAGTDAQLAAAIKWATRRKP